MADQEILLNSIKKRIPAASDVWSGNDGNTIFVSIEMAKISPRADASHSSKRQLLQVQSYVERFEGKVLKIIYAGQDVLENGLQKILYENGLTLSQPLSVSVISAGKVDLYIGLVNDEERLRAIEVVQEYLASLGISFSSINWGTPKTQIRDPQIIRAVKGSQPVSIEGLAVTIKILYEVEFNLVRLRTRLDTLRRKGILVRNPNGTYALTYSGIKMIPSIRSGVSADIDRVLALGKRKW